jgi:hypothetical protein
MKALILCLFVVTTIGATCPTMTGIKLAQKSLAEFPSVGSSTACCSLCTTNKQCTAWTISNSTCELKSDLSEQEPDQAAVSGFLPTANTHYSKDCLPDEVSWTTFGVSGGICAPKCAAGTNVCPMDTPPGTTATPACHLGDPLDITAKLCALPCSGNQDCGTGMVCARGPRGVCVWPEDELRLFRGDDCPQGWEEADFAKGFLLVGRPDGGKSGSTLNQALATGESSRVGSHTHTINIDDPGHSHELPQGQGYNGPNNELTHGYGPDGQAPTDSATTGITASADTNDGASDYPLAYVLLCKRSAPQQVNIIVEVQSDRIK